MPLFSSSRRAARSSITRAHTAIHPTLEARNIYIAGSNDWRRKMTRALLQSAAFTRERDWATAARKRRQDSAALWPGHDPAVKSTPTRHRVRDSSELKRATGSTRPMASTARASRWSPDPRKPAANRWEIYRWWNCRWVMLESLGVFWYTELRVWSMRWSWWVFFVLCRSHLRPPMQLRMPTVPYRSLIWR